MGEKGNNGEMEGDEKGKENPDIAVTKFMQTVCNGTSLMKVFCPTILRFELFHNIMM